MDVVRAHPKLVDVGSIEDSQRALGSQEAPWTESGTLTTGGSTSS